MLRYSMESLWRNRGRYALFGILFAILGGAWLISLLLGSAADQLRRDLIAEYGTTVILEEIGAVSGSPDEALYERFNDPSLVRELTYTGFTQANVYMALSSTVKKDHGGVMSYSGTARTTYAMVGYDYTLPYTPFTRRSEPYPLTEGRLPEADGECMLFDEAFAYLKKKGVLQAVGDSIRVSVYHIDAETMQLGAEQFILNPPEPEYRYLTVVGLVDFAAVDDYRFVHRTMRFSDRETGEVREGSYRKDVIFVTTNEAKQYPAIGSDVVGMLGQNDDRLPKYDLVSRVDAVYTLHDFAAFEEFQAMVQAYNRTLVEEALAEQVARKGEEAVRKADIARPDVPAYRARTYFDGFAALIEPLSTLGDFSAQMARNLTLLVATLLMILTMYDLYARTYEIGVLRCVGMSRLRISAMLMLEHGLFLLTALLAGIGVAVLAANTAIPLLFDAAYRDYLIDALGGLGQSVGRILLTGVGLSGLASLCAAVYIQRCRPLAILRNRN